MPPERGMRISRRELVRQLGESLGLEKAEEVVSAAAARLSLTGEEYDRDQALTLFEELTNSPGLVGVVARFAKVRLILK